MPIGWGWLRCWASPPICVGSDGRDGALVDQQLHAVGLQEQREGVKGPDQSAEILAAGEKKPHGRVGLARLVEKLVLNARFVYAHSI